jgi:hypothetical protein
MPRRSCFLARNLEGVLSAQFRNAMVPAILISWSTSSGLSVRLEGILDLACDLVAIIA